MVLFSLWVELFTIALVFITAFILVWKIRAKQTDKEPKKLKSFGVLDLIIMLSLSFLTPRDVNGHKESAFKKIYDRYLSSNSKYSKEPHLIKLFGIPLGIAVYDYESFREIIHSDASLDRGPLEVLNLYSKGNPGGMLMNNGEPWKETKKYTMKKLGQLGFGKRDKMTGILLDLLPDLLERIESLKIQTGNKIQVQGLFSLAVVNVIWGIAGGEKFSEDDPTFKSLYKTTLQLTSIHFFNLYALYLVKEYKIVRNIFGYKELCKSLDLFYDTFETFIGERKSLEFYKKNPETFVDYYLLEIEKNKSNERLKNIYCTEQLIAILQDLFIAGMDTTSKYLETVFLFMATYPEIQLKVQNEIDTVIGSYSLPLYNDYKNRMPYTVATMMEVHRMVNIIGLSPRCTTRNAKLGRHDVKKGTIVGLMYFALRMDDSYWGDVDVFRPERFLDANHNIIQEKINHVLIFGFGPRACPGEHVSMSTSFTMLIGILRKYSIKKAISSEVVGIEETFGFVNGPHPFHISVFER